MANVVAGNVNVAYGREKAEYAATGMNASKATSFGVEYLYSLSKRTTVYAALNSYKYTDLDALVDWVEHGRAPERIVAGARGAGNPGGANSDVPADWSPTRTRPLCPYPLLARYTAGDTESAASFACQR